MFYNKYVRSQVIINILTKSIEIYEKYGRPVYVKDFSHEESYVRKILNSLAKQGYYHKVNSYPRLYYPNVEAIKRLLNTLKLGNIQRGSISLELISLLDYGDIMIHNIRVGFRHPWSEFWDDLVEVLRRRGWKCCKGRLISPVQRVRSRRRWSKVILYQSSGGEVYLACSDDPIEFGPGIYEIVDWLVDIRENMIFTISAITRTVPFPGILPAVNEWMIKSWELNRDGELLKFEGERFSITIGNLRVYLKNCSKLRVEEIQRVSKTIKELLKSRQKKEVEPKIASGFWNRWEKKIY